MSACPCGCGHRPAETGNKLRPVVCHGCGFNYRVTRRWIAQMDGLPTCPCCGYGMDFPCIADLVLVDETEAQKRPEYGRVVLGITRAMLQNTGGAGRQLRCGGCNVFVPAINHHCGNCGFVNDIRGHRNDGHWSSIPPKRDEIPF